MIPFLVSIPKSGTHMIRQSAYRRAANIPYGSMIYEADPNQLSIDGIKKASTFGVSHLPYHPAYELALKNKAAKVVFLYRDPRDLLVSYYFWIKKLGHSGESIPGLIDDVSTILDSDDPFSVMISFWGAHIRRYLPWMFVPGVFCMPYERLIQEPDDAFDELSEFWERRFGTGKQMRKRIKPLKCTTFRKGIVGDWKNHLTVEHNLEIIEKFGAELRFLGYAL